MVTYNTKYANNSHILDEDGLKASATRSKVVLQQSTPFDEAESSFVSRKNKRTSAHFYGSQKFSVFKKSKTFQSQNQLMQNEIEVSSSPIFKKLNVKQNRKCRRSNTTFTMAGARKSRIIDYFNNLQMTKPIRKDPKLFRSHNEISSGLNLANAVRQPRNKVELNASNTSSTKNADGSKDEIEKIQDLFFYDESLLSNNGVENVTDDKHILSTFLDSPISVTTEESHDIVTPSVKTNESKLVQMRDMTSTGNSIEKFRRSSSMPGLNEPNLSIHVNNNSKINALKVLGDESTITPKKSLNFDQNDLLTNSIESITMSAVQSPVTFEESDDEPKPFVRGHPRNLSKNIKQMFKNVIKLQLDALSNLEKFYEAQLLKVEADRRQNLEMNPANKDKINEFFDKQLELLEERVQNNLESISKDKQKKLASTTSLKFDSVSLFEFEFNFKKNIIFNNIFQPNEDMEDSIHNKTSKSFQKQLFSQKLAQIITSNQTCNNNMGLGRRSQSKNLLDLKNNLINQKNLLPSKIVSNQTNDFSPKNATFKRNLSLPFKQCKQNYRRVRNESVNEAFKLNQVSSPPELSVVGTSLKGQPLMDHEFFYQKNQSNYKSTNNSPEVKKAREVTNNLAKIVKLTKADDKKIFVISANSAFKPVKRNIQSHASASDCLANHDQAFKPIVLDVRRNSSIFYSDDSTDEKNVRKNMPMPRLSDSHLLFKIKQEKRLNDKKIMNTYQRQFQSKMSSNFTSKSNFHIETEV